MITVDINETVVETRVGTRRVVLGLSDLVKGRRHDSLCSEQNTPLPQVKTSSIVEIVG